MKYSDYEIDDFVSDSYFQKWVLNTDTMTSNFWDNWVERNPDKAADIEKAKRMVKLLAYEEHPLSKEDFDDMWQNIIDGRQTFEKGMVEERRNLNKQGKERVPLWKMENKYFKIAAVFIGIIALCYGMFLSGILGTGNREMQTVPQITLELEDGTIRIMDENATGAITAANGKNVGLQQQNTLLYNQDNRQGDMGELIYNKLTVPYGKTFELVLSDGSHIVLNAGSKLRYPVRFVKGRPRNVFLDGEAFFEVAKDDRHPFTVVTDDMNTQVYGTEFNVSSYKNDHNTFTVLAEGSVGVYPPNSPAKENPVKIVPGQRAIFEKGKIAVEAVDILKYTAWTKGELYFLNDRFDIILRKLERNFNVKIENRYPELNDKKFTGTFTTEALEDILKIFRMHTAFDYQKGDNNHIILNKPTKNQKV
ncbi:DUF4974 domain-containing protein [Sinomicrobium pectinilyticum]|uniref:DUF4974 domain-containing protein n=1 Tax=Sinomicrobium pectinilyticum TaxID=1084421 RepID=A0A3N0ER19_SINP1|nr:FecR domain-containing protein [Sinomicrobium pectinilyticum]RNL90326.1 DUF4974 domain-containing protein [Sinomicrobium pectinilyticum]